MRMVFLFSPTIALLSLSACEVVPPPSAQATSPPSMPSRRATRPFLSRPSRTCPSGR